FSLIVWRLDLLNGVIDRDDGLKEIVNTTRGHQGVGDCGLFAHKIVADDRFQLRNYLAVSRPRVVACTAKHRYLKQKFIGNKRVGQFHDSWPVATKMLADQIEIAIETTIGASQLSIDAAIFECSKCAPCELRHRKQFEHVAVADLADLFLVFGCLLVFPKLHNFIREGESIERLDILLRISCSDRGVGYAQHAATLVSAKL